jgi:hypothetical protein
MPWDNFNTITIRTAMGSTVLLHDDNQLQAMMALFTRLYSSCTLIAWLSRHCVAAPYCIVCVLSYAMTVLCYTVIIFLSVNSIWFQKNLFLFFKFYTTDVIYLKYWIIVSTFKLLDTYDREIAVTFYFSFGIRRFF